MKSYKTRKTVLSVLALILTTVMLAATLLSCDNGGGNTTAAPGDTTKSPDATTAEPAFDASGIVSKSYGKINEKGVTYLTFDGENATLYSFTDGKNLSVTGKYSFTKDTFTIGETGFTFKAVSSFFNLTGPDGTKYPLSAASDEDMKLYVSAYALFSGKWEGDDMKLSVDAENKLEFSVGGRSMKTAYTFRNYDVTAKEEAAGGQTEGGGNLAYQCNVTSSGKQNDSYPENYAVDDSVATRFSAAYSGVENPDGAWLMVDLGEPKTFSCVTIYWETACGKDYEIQVSDDGVNFTTVYTKLGNTTSGTADSAAVVHEFEATTARYVKMQGLVRNTKYGYSIWEFRVLAAPLTQVEFKYELDGTDMKITYEGKTYTLKPVQ